MKISQLETEVAKLQEIKKEEETKVAHAQIVQKSARASKTPQEETTDFGQTFKATYKMQLVATEACYNLVIDSQLAVQELILQSNVPVDILSTHKINVIKEKPAGCRLLCMIRMDSQDQRRITIKIRTTEGQNGLITAIIIPHTESIAVPLEIPVKALNLHSRVKLSEKHFEGLPASQVKISGKFDIEDALQWLNNCMPEAPPISDQEVSLGFKQSFIGTHLLVKV